MWLYLLRIAPNGFVAPVACLFATLAYERGDNELAYRALDRATVDDPKYALTILLRRVFGSGWPAAAFAAMVALHSGVGQVVDVNLLTTIFQMMGPVISLYKLTGELQPRLGSGLPYTVPRGVYQCVDGKWVGVSESRDYRNYWHAYVEMWGERLHNDSYQNVWFNDADDDEEWTLSSIKPEKVRKGHWKGRYNYFSGSSAKK